MDGRLEKMFRLQSNFVLSSIPHPKGEDKPQTDGLTQPH
jgi:hypothetical protein